VPEPAHDVIVVGSGAGGGMAAYALTRAGVRVLLLEAGRDYDPALETPMWNLPEEAPLRGTATPDKPMGYYDATVDGGWEVPREPYTLAEGTDFRWWRARMLGGRTNHWGRISLRMGPYDFTPRSRDGLGLDWPIGYEDLAPYYDRVESLIGVFGSNEGLENTPDSSPGVLLPPPPLRGYEMLAQRACAKLGIPAVPSHLAILTRPLAGRAACVYATSCARGCAIGANFQTPTVLLPPALATGRLEIRTGAMVREVTIDAAGRATGVHYVEKATGRDLHAEARVVVLAASGCESARILLNSKSGLFPDGLANGSGKVGRYLMDTVGSSQTLQVSALENAPHHNEDGVSLMHLYMPWWKYGAAARGELDFPRGYHIELGGGRSMPGIGTFAFLGQLTPFYGARLKIAARRYYGSFVNFAGRGEMIPNERSYCEIDPDAVDEMGIPVLRFHFDWSEHEERQAAHMQRSFAEIADAMGARPIYPVERDGSKAIAPGGTMMHEVGTTVMGADPEQSVLNGHGQSWDVENLFVMDAGPFASNSDKNPTLTILALAWRSSDRLVAELTRRNL
jgi:choline dehydrogenase-like flavoprotein